MVRETRHLWVGNLPENIREDRIREHFKRYGRVQSVKLLPRLKEDEGTTGLCATVAFMDIKSASKAHNMEHKLDERCLSTEYYEPAAIPGGSAAPIYVAPRFPHGPAEDHATFERSSHFYERREGDAYLRRPASGYHVPDPLRGRARDRLYRNGPAYTQLLERTQPAHHRALGNAWSYEGTPSVRYPPATPTPDPYPEERREVQPVVHKKRPKSSRSGSESASNSGSSRSRSRSRSRSHSSSSSSQSGSSSCSSGTSSPTTDKSCSPHSSHHGTVRSGRVGGVALQSTVSAPHTNNVSPGVHSEDRRPLAICVRNLPIRSSDTSLKDGLFHEYKKHGKVTSVKVVGQAGDRYAIVCFKKADDAEKALEVSHDKLFFGCKIEVAPYQGYDVDDNEFRPYEAEQDEFHPKATRTLFIGNLEKDVTASELRKHFEQFGEIIEIDIKKQGGLSSYAFCQFADISSVVKAMRSMDGEHLGNNRIKLGFGKSMATNCVWVDGVAENVSDKYLNMQFHPFGAISHVTVDSDRGHALIYFEQVLCAQEAVREMRGFMLRGRKLQVDFASRECQEAFYEHLEKQGHAVVGGERPWERYDNKSREVQASRFETTVVVPGSTRFTRYEAPQRTRAASYNRNANSSVSTPVAASGAVATVVQGRTASRTQRVGQRYEYYDAEYPERRYRNYDEFSQGSGASHDDSYEQELRDYGYCQRERGDSSPSPITCESEGLRRSVAVVARPVRSDKSSSPCDKVEEDSAFKRHALQSVVVSEPQQAPPPLPPPPALPQHPPDIRHLQKERVHIQHLLEQLEDCTSSGDEDASAPSLVPKKRLKLSSEECGGDPAGVPVGMCGGAVDGCFDGLNHGDGSATSLLVTTHNHRKSVSEVRRMSDVGKHCSRRLSTDSLSKHGNRDVRETSVDRLVSVQVYSPHPVCKRRKTGSSASESEDRISCRSGKHSHHHHHHHNDGGGSVAAVSGSESVDGSRPGTPLCDERPENLLPPSEPRRIPRERTATDGPLSLPLPRFAAQVLSASPRLPVSISGTPSKSVPSTSIVSSPPSAVTSPRTISHPVHPLHPPPSPSPAPPPASPPPRPPSLLSSSSSDSEISPPSPTLEERIRSLDEKYEKWSGSRALSLAGGDVLAKIDASVSERFRFRHKFLNVKLTELQPSDIVKSVLAKRSVFDEDSKRLENFSDKYEPREFVPYTRTGCFQSLRVKTECAAGTVPQCGTPTKLAMSPSPINTTTTPIVATKLGPFPAPSTATQLPPRLMGTQSPLHSPSQPLPKSPFSGGTPTTLSPVIKPPHMSLSPVGTTPCGKLQSMPKTTSAVSPRPTGTGLPAAKGLQYPFPSHPPVLPTTTVATTTATNAIGLVPVSSAGVKPSLSVTVPTTATGTVLSPEVSRTCGTKPSSIGSVSTSIVHSLEVSRPSVVRTVSSVTVLTTVTGTKPSPEVASRSSLKIVSSTSTVLSTASCRVPSPGIQRLTTCAKAPLPTITTTAVVDSVLSPEVARTPVVGPKCSGTMVSSPELPKMPSTFGTQATSRGSTATLSPPQATSRVTSPTVISSLQITSRVSTTAAVKVSMCSAVTPTTTTMSSPSSTVQVLAKLSRPIEPPPKISSSAPTRTEMFRPGSNIPSIKLPSFLPSSDSLSISITSPRVVIPVTLSSATTPIVTTVAAASTVTTTVMTVAVASTSVTSVTSTIFATSVVTPSMISVTESTRHGKPKSCIVTKKDSSMQSQLSSKDKQCDMPLSNKPVPVLKKETPPLPAASSPTKKDVCSRELDVTRNSSNHKSKSVTVAEERRERKDSTGVVCTRRDSEREIEVSDKRRERSNSCDEKRRESADTIDRRKEREVTECLERDRRKDSHSVEAEKERRRDSIDNTDKEKRKEKEVIDSTERERQKENVDSMDRRKDVEFGEKERWKDMHLTEVDKERWKEREETQEKDRRKEAIVVEGVQKESELEKDRRKERRKDRTSSSSSPASIGCKRRMSSQDSLESVPDDAKRLKLSPAVNVEHHKVPERRDSKDSGRSSSSSKRSSGERPRHGDKTFAKMLEDKIREERRQSKDDLDRRREKDSKLQEGFERHKTKEKQRKKSKGDRDSPKDPGDLIPKPTKESINDKDFSPQSIKKKDDSEPEDREDKHRHLKREKEKKKLMKDEFGSTEFLEEKGKSTKKDREKRSSSERRKEENTIKEESKCMLQKKESKILKKEFSHSDTDSEDGSGDGPKKHSIFDIVDDGPAYISMYDKVKARSTKNMQKQEEEKRQEKMREKFNLLKQSRAKREEKKRSTSWDEDSDSDNPDRERGSKASKRLAKLMISSSSEDDGRLRSAYDCEDMKVAKGRPVVRIKKEDIIMGKSDSDSDAQQHHSKSVVTRDAKHLEGSEDDDGSARTKHLLSTARKGSRAKLVSDTSEDDNSSIGRFKSNAHKTPEIYSADSDVDLEYADSDEKPSHLKKLNTKNSKVTKNALDSSNDENTIKPIPDGVKVLSDKQLVFKKTIVKNKILESSDDENTKKLPCDPVKDDVFGDDKQAIFRKSIAKNKTCKISLDSSDDDSARKLLAESAKTNACIDDKHANFKKFTAKNKIKTPLDSSDDDTVRKLSADSLKNDMYTELIQPSFKKTFNKNKTTKLFPDSSGEESIKPFVLQSEKDEIFNDNIQLKVSLHNKGDLALENVSDVEPSATTPPQLEKVLFYSNSVGKGIDSPRKKSHKKKQKKQKLSQSSEEALSKIMDHEAEPFDKLQGDNCLPTEDGKTKGDSERKKHKRERRKSTHSKTSDGDGKPPKVRKKKSAKPELGVLKPESSLKREEKMEDIFGPLSDDSEPGHIKATPPPQNNGGRMFDKLPGKWQVSLVYGSDSDSNIDASVLNSRLEKERKRREKKRRERKAREEESLAVDLAEAGRALEAKLMDEDDYLEDTAKPGLIKGDGVKQEPSANDTDVFRFTDGDESLETTTTILLEKVKEKKKKRKKSKEEKQSRREHHHHHHHDKVSSKSSPERRSSVTVAMEDSKPPPEPSPSLPTLDMPLSPPLIKPVIPLLTESSHAVLQCHDPSISTAPKISPIVSKNNEKKKLEKFIPGFGSEIDDTIHETAVKSISEFEAPKPEAMLGVKVEETVKVEEMLPKSNGEGIVADEEKPRAVISQEETEDAVKALLGESFGRGFGDCYVGEGNAGSGSAANSNPPEPQLPTDEEDETRKAVMGLIDMKPDTPQSEHELQIDTDTEDTVEESYPALFSGNDDQPPRPSECIEFPGLPKAPDLPPSFYSHHHHMGTLKPYAPTPALPALPPPTPQELVLPTTEASHKDKVAIESEVKVEPVEPIVKKVEHVEQADPANVPRSPSPASNQIMASDTEGDVAPLPVETVCKVEPKSEVCPEAENSNSKKDKFSSAEEETEEKSALLQEPIRSPSPAIAKTDIKVEKEDEVEETPIPSVIPLVKDAQPERPHIPPSINVQESLKQSLTTPGELSVQKEKSQDDVVEPVSVKQEQDKETRVVTTCKLDQNEADSKVYDLPTSPVTNAEVKIKLETNVEPAKGIEVDVNLAEDKEVKEIVPLIIDEKSQDVFACDSKGDPVCDTRESEFSEPEPDMKTDNDFVTNLLASDTMNRALTEDSTLVEDPRPLFVGSSESNFELFKDRDVEPVSVIKEIDAHQHCFKEEQDPFASPPKTSEAESVSLKEPSFGGVSVGKDDKEDEFMTKGDITNPIKVDSDFWSAKEVNIDSVIKKVDALCSVEDMSPCEEMIDRDKLTVSENKVWFSPLREKQSSPVPEMKGRDKLVVSENKSWFSPLREKEASPVPELKAKDKLAVGENKNWFSPLREKAASPVPELKAKDKLAVGENKSWFSPLREKAASPVPELKAKDKLAVGENKSWFSPLREKEASPVPELKARDNLVVSENKSWFSPLREKEASPVPELKLKDKLVVSETRNWFSPLKEKETSPVPLKEKETSPVPLKEKETSPVPEIKSDTISQTLESPVEPQSAPKEDTIQKVVIKVDEEREEVTSSTEQEQTQMEASPLPEEREDHRIMSASSPEDREHRATSSSSPEEEAQDGSMELDSRCHSTATPRMSRRGRRGAGGRRKMATRAVAGVMTRRTRLTAGRDSSSTPVSPRRGRGGRGAKVLTHESLAQVKQKLSTDVYEFHDDSEEEGNNGGDKGRPRLILTIKSPVSASSINSTLSKDGSKPPPSPITSPVVETREEFPTTRKSRRLQERDGSRTTVDDIIEDVVRGAAIVTRSAAAAATAVNQSLPPRRSTRQNNGGQKPAITIVEPRKSPRGIRKQMFPNRCQDESSDEKKKSEEDLPTNKPTGEVVTCTTQTPTLTTLTAVTITTSSTTITTATTAVTSTTTTSSSITTCTTTSTTITAPAVSAPSTEVSLEKVTSPSSTGILSGTTSKPQQSSQGNPLLAPTPLKERGSVDREPMTLIDPVTGLLIPMRESEEGQYIPVTTAATNVGNLPPTTTTNTTTTTSTVSTRPVTESADLAPNEVDKSRTRPTSLASTTIKTSPLRASSDGSLWTSGAPAQSHVPVISNPSQSHVSVATSATAVRPLAICKPGTMPSPLPGKPTPTAMLLGTTAIRPHAAFKTHILQQPGKVVATSLQQPVSTQTHTLKAIHHAAQPVIKSTSGSTLPSSASSTAPAKVRDVLPGQMPLALGTVKGGPTTVAVNPKAYLLQAVPTNKPLTASGQPSTTGPSPMPPLSVTKVLGLAGQPQKPVGPAVSLNPKTHLLQAPPKTGVPPGTYTTLQIPAGGKAGLMHHHPTGASPPSQKAHVTMSKTLVTASPPLSQPPKAHHGLAQQPILTGAVASPPLKVPHHGSQQPVVTGASSSRAGVPKPLVPSLPGPHLAPHAKGLMDPPKVEVSIGGCIVVPTASPQQRGQVMQAGLPVPAYEASLGEVVQHVAFSHNMRVPSHELAPHYVHSQLAYQQYLRAHQEALGAHIPYHLTPGAVRSPMLPGMDVKSEPESEEARGSSPPLELRRPASGGSSLGARGGGMAAHSLQSPHDRATDSPQVATVYVQHAARLAHYTPPQPQQPPRYYEPGPEPPPAHLRAARHHHPMPGTEAPASQPRLQVATPPHASQVPPQADSLLMLLQRYPVMWQGLLALKNDQAAVQMHFVFGNPHVARDSLPCNSDGSTPPLRISQRMRLEQTQVEGVARKMQMDNEHCMLLALPCGRDHMDVLQQSNNLRTGFITYLQQKQAAGIVNIAAPGSQQAAYVVHIFPSCDFANDNLARIAPDLLHRVADIAHLLIIIATV